MHTEKLTANSVQKSVSEKLQELYSRRSAVESLIRSLESYVECQAKNGSERLKEA
jgi:hypothetical protein